MITVKRINEYDLIAQSRITRDDLGAHNRLASIIRAFRRDGHKVFKLDTLHPTYQISFDGQDRTDLPDIGTRWTI